MKRILIYVGVVIVLGIAAAGGWFYLQYQEGLEMIAAAKSYADSSIKSIATNWDSKELSKRASKEMQSSLANGADEKAFTVFRMLGKLKQHQLLEDGMKINKSFDTGQGTAEFNAKADFEKGPANIRLQLVDRGSGWQISGFNVNSPVIAELLAQKAKEAQDPAAKPEPDKGAPAGAPAVQAKAEPMKGDAPKGEPAKMAAADVPAKPLAPGPTTVAAPAPAAQKSAPAGEKPAPAAEKPAAPATAAKAEPKTAPSEPMAAPSEPRPQRMWTANVDLRRCLKDEDNRRVAACAIP